MKIEVYSHFVPIVVTLIEHFAGLNKIRRRTTIFGISKKKENKKIKKKKKRNILQ